MTRTQANPLPEAMVTMTCKVCLEAIGIWSASMTGLTGAMAKARREHARQAHDWRPRSPRGGTA